MHTGTGAEQHRRAKSRHIGKPWWIKRLQPLHPPGMKRLLLREQASAARRPWWKLAAQAGDINIRLL